MTARIVSAPGFRSLNLRRLADLMTGALDYGPYDLLEDIEAS